MLDVKVKEGQKHKREREICLREERSTGNVGMIAKILTTRVAINSRAGPSPTKRAASGEQSLALHASVTQPPLLYPHALATPV